jgi:hypothetical protein
MRPPGAPARPEQAGRSGAVGPGPTRTGGTIEQQLWADLLQGLNWALGGVGLAGDAEARRLAASWLEAYVRGAGRYDAALCTLRWSGPPSYTGFDLSQLALLAGVVLGRPPALQLWGQFRQRTADDLLAALGGPQGEDARVACDHVAREFDEAVADARERPGSVHCLERAYQNAFRAHRRAPPGALPVGWQFGLAAPPRLVAGRPFLPTAADREAFVETECKRLRALRCVLQGLQQIEVSIVLGLRRLTALELVYLRYRGSPAAVPQRTPSAEELVALLAEAGWTARRGGTVTRENLEKILSRDVRGPAQQQVDAAQAAGRLPAQPGQRWEALTRPDGYVWGGLFRRHGAEGGGS